METKNYLENVLFKINDSDSMEIKLYKEYFLNDVDIHVEEIRKYKEFNNVKSILQRKKKEDTAIL